MQVVSLHFSETELKKLIFVSAPFSRRLVHTISQAITVPSHGSLISNRHCPISPALSVKSKGSWSVNDARCCTGRRKHARCSSGSPALSVKSKGSESVSDLASARSVAITCSRSRLQEWVAYKEGPAPKHGALTKPSEKVVYKGFGGASMSVTCSCTCCNPPSGASNVTRPSLFISAPVCNWSHRMAI